MSKAVRDYNKASKGDSPRKTGSGGSGAVRQYSQPPNSSSKPPLRSGKKRK